MTVRETAVGKCDLVHLGRRSPELAHQERIETGLSPVHVCHPTAIQWVLAVAGIEHGFFSSGACEIAYG